MFNVSIHVSPILKFDLKYAHVKIFYYLVWKIVANKSVEMYFDMGLVVVSSDSSVGTRLCMFHLLLSYEIESMWTGPNNWICFRKSFLLRAWSLMMFLQDFIQSIAYLLGCLVPRDHQFGAFWLRIKVRVRDWDVRTSVCIFISLGERGLKRASNNYCLLSIIQTPIWHFLFLLIFFFLSPH